MTDLSPAAQAVLDAYQLAPIEDELTAAAVLRAAADQLHHDPGQSHQVGGIIASRLQLLAIATELENTHG